MYYEDIFDEVNKIVDAKWAMWVHEGTEPAVNHFMKEAYVLSGAIRNCCSECINLNGCYFNEYDCPEIPLHPGCHCYLVPLEDFDPECECPIQKFRDYVFVSSEVNDKKQLFESFGYSIMDSEYLKAEFEKQAREKYRAGNYKLNLRDAFGQRINIVIELKNQVTGEIVRFKSGWMVYPGGKLRLTTTFGGWV